ncbi:hypothetical protein EmuJ_000135400 [Echinococcus multilocularis]|uniref:Uncharacterized protein n=1 Tax=Echinococcus multilocularis TaxID=6211 RepID=A0A087VZE4_ECHMU|nr:hypothetical protein EmuJ_000135400 [Echinococcus multilocularis]
MEVCSIPRLHQRAVCLKRIRGSAIQFQKSVPLTEHLFSMSPFTYPLAFPLSSSIAPTHHYPFIGARTPDHHGDSCGGAGGGGGGGGGVGATLPHPIPSLLQPTSLIAPPSFQQNTSFSHLFPPLSLPPPTLPPFLFNSPPFFPPSFLPFHPILFSLSPLLLLHLYLLLLLLLLLLTHTHSYTHTHLVATFLPACLLHSLP